MNLWRSFSYRWTTPAILCAALVGCGKGGASLTPVEGKVMVNGAPLTTGSVTFQPDAGKGNQTPHIPVGTIDGIGTYKLMTATKDGAPPGWYKVAVSAQESIDPKNPYAPPKHLIDSKYSDPTTSGLAIEVVANPKAGAYDLKLAK